MEILQPEQQVMAAALQVRAARAELLAGNVANADTPGYLARDIKFNAALDHVLENEANSQIGDDSFETTLARENTGIDKNDIDVNEQLAKSYENSLSYVATLKLYGDSVGRLKSATASS
jgi:flagellar basal-body rod protein FlgB